MTIDSSYARSRMACAIIAGGSEQYVTLGYNSSGKDQQQHAVMGCGLMMYKSKRFVFRR